MLLLAAATAGYHLSASWPAADRPRCACAFRFQRDLQGSRCPMCCAHCNGVFEMPGDQGLHAAGCANDGAGKFEQWNAPR